MLTRIQVLPKVPSRNALPRKLSRRAISPAKITISSESESEPPVKRQVNKLYIDCCFQIFFSYPRARPYGRHPSQQSQHILKLFENHDIVNQMRTKRICVKLYKFNKDDDQSFKICNSNLIGNVNKLEGT